MPYPCDFWFLPTVSVSCKQSKCRKANYAVSHNYGTHYSFKPHNLVNMRFIYTKADLIAEGMLSMYI